jgi:hypothetical protein
MIDVRRAAPEDAGELMRLRVVLLSDMPGAAPVRPAPWLEAGAEVLRA